MRKPPVVIYHGSCFDGHTAAWVFHHLKGDAEFHSVNYGDAGRPDCKGREVYLLDFSYSREIMKEIILESERTTVFDHHKTAEAALAGILQEIRKEYNINREHDRIVFDMNRSGAGITFDILEEEGDRKRGFKSPRFNGERAWWIVDYVEDRDLWRMKLPKSHEIAAWTAATPMTFDAWDKLNALGPDGAAMRGEAVLAYMDVYGEKALAHERMENIAGYVVPTVNLAYMNCSEYVGRLLKANPHEKFAASYFRRKDGKWQFSLRSREDFDVSEVAKAFGGGGHAQAAGFEVERLPWDADTQPSLAPVNPYMPKEYVERILGNRPEPVEVVEVVDESGDRDGTP